MALTLFSVSTSVLAFVGLLVVPHAVSTAIVMLVDLVVVAFLAGLRLAEKFFFG